MLAYTIRRILLVIPTLLAVAVLVFFVLRVVPGDIVEIKLAAEGGIISAEEIQKEKERLGLDDPIMVQFYKYRFLSRRPGKLLKICGFWNHMCCSTEHPNLYYEGSVPMPLDPVRKCGGQVAKLLECVGSHRG